MQLFRLYLPLRDNAGESFSADMFRAVETELSSRFGGVTAHLEAPASGLWRDGVDRYADRVVIFEVLDGVGDREWWTTYRDRLARDFRQKSILMMLQPVDVV